jgi:1,2-phenylacetyl-CoA epoxidase PaaB subunit
MSKLRQNIPTAEGDLEFPPEGDLQPYVIFTQLKTGQPHVLAGYLDAPDHEMAMILAREHYGRDQESVSIWGIPRDAVAGTEAAHPVSSEPGARRTWHVFVQAEAGEPSVSAGTVEADCSAAALDAAKAILPDLDDLTNIWVVPDDAILRTAEGELTWPLSDQSYRLARGYSKSVREKWQQIRAEKDLTEYEKDDLKDAF